LEICERVVLHTQRPPLSAGDQTVPGIAINAVVQLPNTLSVEATRIYNKYTLHQSGDDLVLVSPDGVTMILLAELDEIIELGEEWKSHIRIKNNGNGNFAYLNTEHALVRIDVKELLAPKPAKAKAKAKKS